MMKKVSERVFIFKEDRIFDPASKELFIYESIIDLNDYTHEEMFECVRAFGYSLDEMLDWINNGVNLDLIAECIFEMET